MSSPLYGVCSYLSHLGVQGWLRRGGARAKTGKKEKKRIKLRHTQLVLDSGTHFYFSLPVSRGVSSLLFFVTLLRRL